MPGPPRLRYATYNKGSPIPPKSPGRPRLNDGRRTNNTVAMIATGMKKRPIENAPRKTIA
jgi:hypothetical protein